MFTKHRGVEHCLNRPKVGAMPELKFDNPVNE
jgi:hypothetical protein